MITIEQWRAAIGNFNHAHYGCCSKFKNQLLRCIFVYFAKLLFVLVVLCCWSSLVNLSMGLLIFFKLLRAGDVELNPGPTYNISKIVQASFHQGHSMFGASAGTQCVCNALFAVCWTKIKNVSFWNSCDLDYILIKGDELYKSINLYRYLEPADLPNVLNVESVDVTIDYVQLVTVQIQKDYLDFIQPSFVNLSDQSNGIIFFVSNNTSFSLLWNKKYFFLFDSHSRNDQGKISPNGTAILIKFTSLGQVQKYVIENYLLDRGHVSVYCQLQYIKVDYSGTNLTDVVKKSICRKRKLLVSKCVQPNEYEESLKKKRKNYADFSATKGYNKRSAQMSSPEYNELLKKRREKYANKKKKKKKIRL